MAEVTSQGGDDAPRDAEGMIARIQGSIDRMITDFTTVRVITMIAASPVDIVKDDKSDVRTLARIDTATKGAAFVTEVDLVDGDLLNIYPENYDQHAEIAALHTDSVAKASKVVPQNLQAMVNAATALIRALKSDD